MSWSEMNQKQRQNMIRLGLLAMLGVALLCIGGRGDGTEQQSSQPAVQKSGAVSVQLSTSVSALERQLEQTLMQVKGAGDVTVQITVNDLGRKEYARDIQKTERSTTEINGDNRQQTTEMQEQQTVVQQAGQGGALLLEETMPEIRGVLIVATGAGQASVQEQLLQAAATVLQVSAGQIMVLPGEGGAVHE